MSAAGEPPADLRALLDLLAGRLHDAAAGPAGAGAHDPDGPAECRVCPVCQAVRVLRTLRPDVVEHLEAATGELVAAVRALLTPPDGPPERPAPAPPAAGEDDDVAAWHDVMAAASRRPPVQHIEIGE